MVESVQFRALEHPELAEPSVLGRSGTPHHKCHKVRQRIDGATPIHNGNGPVTHTA